MPKLIAPRVTLSISKFRIMHSTAPCSVPTRFSAGTCTSSNTSSAVIEALIPHLSSTFCPSVKPGTPFSTMNMLTSRGSFPVRAYTRKASPVWLPSTVPRSECSALHQQSAQRWWTCLARCRKEACALGVAAVLRQVVGEQHAVGQVAQAEGWVCCAEFFVNDHCCSSVHACASKLCRHCHTQQAQLSALAE
eukprot:16839-Heterococcus_DN1.PRE.3